MGKNRRAKSNALAAKAETAKHSLNKQNNLAQETSKEKSQELRLNSEILGRSETLKININECSKTRETFMVSSCHTCKEIVGSELQLCPKCQIIRYCSKAHRKAHWPSHADLCQGVVELKNQKNVDHIFSKCVNLSPTEFRAFRYNLLVECENIIERPLELWEREMFLFPGVCMICYSADEQRLTLCDVCNMIYFCSEHIGQIKSHKSDWCKSLKLYRDFILDEFKNGKVKIQMPFNTQKEYFKLPLNINDFFDTYHSNLNIFQRTQLSQILTAPLSCLFSIEDILSPPLEKRTEFTIHFIGAETEFELEPIQKWELFFHHLIPNLKVLKLVLVGPELHETPVENVNRIESCMHCKEKGKTVKVIFESGLFYHEYIFSKVYKKPDAICIFNPGLSRMTGYKGEDSWSETIQVMFRNKHIPVVLTAYTHYEILSDLKRIQQNVDVKVLKAPSKNPYSSQRPYRNFISDESVPVIFKNFYLCVLSAPDAD